MASTIGPRADLTRRRPDTARGATFSAAARLRTDLRVEEEAGIRIFLPDSAINSSDRKEFEASSRTLAEFRKKRGARVFLDDIVWKANFIRTFQVLKHHLDLQPGQRVLELGGGHGWASALVKDEHPECHVVASDLVPSQIAFSKNYEDLLQCPLDERWAFSVRDIPFADGQFDRVFTFAAFHHFSDHGDFTGALREIARILRPSGKLVLLYEPSAPRYLYPIAHRRINRRQAIDGVDEGLLRVDRLAAAATGLGLTTEAVLNPIYDFRSSVSAGLYYFLVSKLRLRRLLPCTVTVMVTKPA